MAAPKKRSAKQVATAYFQAIAARDVDALGEQWAPGGIDHFYGMEELEAPDGVKRFFAEMFRAVPDFSMSVTDMVTYGEKAAVRWCATGNFNGEGKLQGVAPTGAHLEIEGLDLLTIRDGLIQENFAYTNGMEMARQMGVLPPLGSAGERAMMGAMNAKTKAASKLRKVAGR
ncbi:MAG TPA: ester cyclase [Solirubrobacterales bacterium]|nr:ester cyclase [Solirubrobacterales bacterium]